MENISDKLLIGFFQDYCAEREYTLDQIGQSVGRTKSWASRFVNGHITKLQYVTRIRIKKVLGIQ